MGRIAWSQLRFRTARSVALLAGMLLAVTAFTVLTAASRTSQLTTIGTISAHFRPAYDILVRPQASRTRLESQTGTVQPNFLSGIYGGITLAQYHQIQQVPGVAVAAPIAMVGYTLPTGTTITVPLPAATARRPGRQLYRYDDDVVSAGGTAKDSSAPFVRLPDPGPHQFGQLPRAAERGACRRAAGQGLRRLPGACGQSVQAGRAVGPLVLVKGRRTGLRGGGR